MNICTCIHREIYERFRASYKGKDDIHTKMMRRYKDIPSWWFYLLLVVTVAVSLVLCIFLNDQVQMPWWGLLFACVIAFIFTLPISIITATTNQVIKQKVYVHQILAIISTHSLPREHLELCIKISKEIHMCISIKFCITFIEAYIDQITPWC